MERPVSGVRSVYRRGGGPVRACSVRTHAHSGIRPNGRIRILPQQCLSSSGWLAVLSRSSHGRWRDGNVGRPAARGREGRGAPAAPVRRTRTRLPTPSSPPNSSALLERRRSRRCDRAAYKKVNIRLTNQKTLFATVSATLHAPLDTPLPNRADTTVRFVNPPRTVVAAHDRRKANRKTAEVTRRHQHLRSVRDREQLPSAHAAAGQMTIYPAQAPLPPPAMEASVAEARAQGRCRRAR